MNRWRVPLSVPELGPDERNALTDAFDAGWPSAGPRTQAFEDAFSRAACVPHALAVSSGTAALHLAMTTLDLVPGDEVVVPSLTFVATVNAVALAGGTAVFADVSSVDDPCISAATVAPVVTPRTRAIVAVHYGGMPCEMDGLRALARERGLLLLEDAAHAPGATLDGRPVGSLGDIACFSFYATKNLTTVEGGMVTTHDAGRAERVRRLRSHGLTAHSWERHLGASPDRDVVEAGLNYRLDDLRAAMGLVQLGSLERRNRRRAEVIARYRQAIAGSDRLAFAFSGVRPGRASACHLAPLLVRSGSAERDALARVLEDAGIQTSHHYVPAHRMTAHRQDGTPLTVTELFASRELTLPLFSTLSDDQVSLVCEALRRWERS